MEQLKELEIIYLNRNNSDDIYAAWEHWDNAIEVAFPLMVSYIKELETKLTIRRLCRKL